MADVTITFKNYTHAQVHADTGIMLELRDYFSFVMDGARFNPKFKYSGWDGKIRLLDGNGNLPIGLVDQLIKYCSQNMMDVEVDEKLKPTHQISESEFDEWLNSMSIKSNGENITPHWYQRDAVFQGLNGNRRTLNLPTSAGKSLIACLLSRYYIENYEGKVLILVPSTTLVNQMIDDFDDYTLIPKNACHGIMAGTAKNTDRLIVVSTWQSACKMPSDWFLQFGQLIVDECHGATAKEIGKIVNCMTHCQFKFGMSGSLRDGKANILQYVGMFGSIFKPVSTAQLIEEGAVSDLKINSIFLRYPENDIILTKGVDYQAEIKHITEHTKRNSWICRLALKLSDTTAKNENTLILFRLKKHGKLLYEALEKKHNGKVIFIDGDTKTIERSAAKIETENGDGIIIVASYGVLSTGVSIKKLHHVIFAHPIKSKVTVLQSIGRVLRKHKTKDKAQLWDIVDNLCVETKRKNAKKKYSHQNYAYKHGIERLERYISESFEFTQKDVNL